MRKRKNERRNKVIIGILFSFIMVTSLASFVLFRQDDTNNKLTLTLDGKEYQFEFIQEAQNLPYYQVESEDRIFFVYNLPDTIKQLNYESEVSSRLANSLYYYISFYPDDSEVSNIDYLRYDLRNSLPAEKYFVDAVAYENSSLGFPVINCENATYQIPVILLKSANFTNITLDNNCVDFQFARYDFFRVRDMLVYSFNGVLI